MKTFALLMIISMPTLAMGRRPTDPATYQDVLDAEAMTSTTNNREIAHYNQTQGDIKATNDRIDKLSETKMLVDTAVRVYDGKRVSVEAFNSFDAAHSQEFAFGTRIVLKLGSSYEERLLKVQAKQIEALQALVNKSGVPLK